MHPSCHDESPAVIAFAQDAIAFAQDAIAFAQDAIAFAQDAIAFAQDAIAFAQDATAENSLMKVSCCNTGTDCNQYFLLCAVTC